MVWLFFALFALKKRIKKIICSYIWYELVVHRQTTINLLILPSTYYSSNSAKGLAAISGDRITKFVSHSILCMSKQMRLSFLICPTVFVYEWIQQRLDARIPSINKGHPFIVALTPKNSIILDQVENCRNHATSALSDLKVFFHTTPTGEGLKLVCPRLFYLFYWYIVLSWEFG